MITSLKLAGLSALLSAGLMSGFAAPDAQLTNASSKIYQDRLGDDSLAASTVSTFRVTTETVERSAKGDRLSAQARPLLTVAAR